jgi:hypothetical protein
VLCPAITDPFRGPHYRLHGLWHQFVATIVSGGFWCFLGKGDINTQDECNMNRFESTNGQGYKSKKTIE